MLYLFRPGDWEWQHFVQINQEWDTIQPYNNNYNYWRWPKSFRSYRLYLEMDLFVPCTVQWWMGPWSTQLHMFTSIINFIFYISIMILKSHLQNTPPHLTLQSVTLIYHILMIASSCSITVLRRRSRGSIHSFLGWSRTVGLASDVYILRLL